MSHLSPAEFVDLLDGALPAARSAHVESCAQCRVQAAALHAVIADTAPIAVPEPSPFFWDRLSSRIRGAVAAPVSPGAVRRLLPLASAAALIVAAFGGAWIARTGGPSPTQTGSPAAPASNSARPRAAVLDDSALDAANGDVWDVLTSVASDMQFDEAAAAGMSVHPAAIDGAVQKMAPDELTELARLLQSELKHPGV